MSMNMNMSMSMAHIDWYTYSVVYTNTYEPHLSLYRGFKYVKDDWLDLLLGEEDKKYANERTMYIQPDYKHIALFEYPFSILFSEVL